MVAAPAVAPEGLLHLENPGEILDPLDVTGEPEQAFGPAPGDRGEPQIDVARLDPVLGEGGGIESAVIGWATGLAGSAKGPPHGPPSSARLARAPLQMPQPPDPRPARRRIPASGRERRPGPRVRVRSSSRRSRGRRLGEEEPDQARDMGVDRLVVVRIGADGVGECHGCASAGFDDPGNARETVGPERARIEENGVDPAIDDTDPLQSGDRPHTHPIVLDGRVAALDLRYARLLGEEHVLEIGRVEDPEREQEDPRVEHLRWSDLRGRLAAAFRDPRPAESADRARAPRRTAAPGAGSRRGRRSPEGCGLCLRARGTDHPRRGPDPCRRHAPASRAKGPVRARPGDSSGRRARARVAPRPPRGTVAVRRHRPGRGRGRGPVERPCARSDPGPRDRLRGESRRTGGSDRSPPARSGR